MDEPLRRTEFDRELGVALREQDGEWTPVCLDPEELVALVDLGGGHPESLRLLSHVATCPYCRHEYLETEQAVRLAGPALSLSGPRVHVMTARLRFEWAALAASTGGRARDFTGVFCGGALRATLWIDGGSGVLTAERVGNGQCFPGALVRFEVLLPAGSVEGYFPLPDGNQAAEIDLGAWGPTPAGDLECRLVPASVLDVGAAKDSVRRSRDLPTLRSWAALAASAPPFVPEDVGDGIRDAVSNASSD